uniref:Endothelial cell surface expressed chemotaxis and apoptosis regulator n=1 Tax=Cavia porcellus TaxID=10141 RepID=H0W6V1_CAVPO
ETSQASLCVLLSLVGHNSQPMTTPTSQAPTQKASPGPLVSSKAGTPRASTEDGHALSLLGLTQSQPQRSTSELGEYPGQVIGGEASSVITPHSISESSQNATPNAITMSLRTRGDLTILPSPTSETVLTVAAFGVISFIVILVVVVIVLVAVVSLRFKCRKNKDAEDPQKPGSSGLSESCSTANGEKHSITLISMKNINMNNSKACPSAEKV